MILSSVELSDLSSRSIVSGTFDSGQCNPFFWPSSSFLLFHLGGVFIISTRHQNRRACLFQRARRIRIWISTVCRIRCRCMKICSLYIGEYSTPPPPLVVRCFLATFKTPTFLEMLFIHAPFALLGCLWLQIPFPFLPLSLERNSPQPGFSPTLFRGHL